MKSLTSPHPDRLCAGLIYRSPHKDRARDYGVIVCPKCGGITDTDLQFWSMEGLTSHEALVERLQTDP